MTITRCKNTEGLLWKRCHGSILYTGEWIRVHTVLFHFYKTLDIQTNLQWKKADEQLPGSGKVGKFGRKRHEDTFWDGEICSLNWYHGFMSRCMTKRTKFYNLNTNSIIYQLYLNKKVKNKYSCIYKISISQRYYNLSISLKIKFHRFLKLSSLSYLISTALPYEFFVSFVKTFTE